MSAPRQLVLTAPRQLRYVPVSLPELTATQVRLRAVLSAISHGTELHLFRGTSPFAEQTFDPNLRVFAPREQPDAAPQPLGYELVGEVIEIGTDVHEVAVGDLVHAPVPHAEEVVVDLAEPGKVGYPSQRLPDGMSAEQGIFGALASVALVAVHDAGIRAGDAVVVSGLGVIGLIALQLARLDGATTVLAVDPVPERREAALRLGAHEALDPEDAPVGRRVKQLLSAGRGHPGADSVIETSGVDSALHEAVAAVGIGGTVVSAGFVQGGAPRLRLGEEWHHNRPQLVSSMGVWDCPHRAHPRWDRDRIARTALRLLATGAVRTDGLLNGTYPFDHAEQAYARLDADPTSATKLALDYRTGN